MNTTAILLPFIAFAGILNAFIKWPKPTLEGRCLRHSFLAASVTWGLVLIGITELLSVFYSITYSGLVMAWMGVCGFVCIINIGVLKKQQANLGQTDERRFALFDSISLYGVFIILAIICIVAISIPAKHGDATSYHLSRVVHWMQNQSIEHYPTPDLRQLRRGPWSEYAIMHLWILSGVRSFNNLISWFSLAGSVIGISLIAERLGAKRGVQIFTSVLAVSLPTAIVQAFGVFNDIVLSFWIICFIYFLLSSLENKSRFVHDWGMAASLGLALITKGVAYIFLLPFTLWVVIRTFKRDPKRALNLISFIVIFVCLLNGGHYIRNFERTQNILGDNSHMIVESYDLPTVFVNGMRNVSTLLFTPPTQWNLKIVRAVTKVEAMLNLSLQGHSWKNMATLAGESDYIKYPFIFNNSTRDYIHRLLILICLILFVSYSHTRGGPVRRQYLACVLISLLLSCFILKTSITATQRILLPLILLFCPVIAMVLSDKIPRIITRVLAVSLVLMVMVMPVKGGRGIVYQLLIIKKSNFESHNASQSYSYRQIDKSAFADALNYIHAADCHSIGLRSSRKYSDYILKVLFEDREYPPLRMKHVLVENNSAVKYGKGGSQDFNPCVILSFGFPEEEALVYEGRIYSKALSPGPRFTLYEKDSTP